MMTTTHTRNGKTSTQTAVVLKIRHNRKDNERETSVSFLLHVNRTFVQRVTSIDVNGRQLTMSMLIFSISSNAR